MKKKLVCLLSMLLLFGGWVGAAKSETVYVLLNPDGSPHEQWVVSRFEGPGPIADYGRYLTEDNLSGSYQPPKGQESRLWPLEAFAQGPVYYRGIPQAKELPISISLSYLLNDVPTTGPDIAGKEGELVISIKLTNQLTRTALIPWTDWQGNSQQDQEQLWVPLAVSVTATIDLDRFSVTDTGGAVAVTAGNNLVLTWSVLPWPESELSFCLQGQDLSVNPLEFSVIPMLPEVELPSWEDLVSLAQGLGLLEGNLQKLAKSSKLLTQGGDALTQGNWELNQGLVQLVQGLSELNQVTVAIDNRLQPLLPFYLRLDSLAGEAEAKLQEIQDALAHWLEASAVLDREAEALELTLRQWAMETRELQQGLDDLLTRREGILAGARLLIENSDPSLQELGRQILAEHEELLALQAKAREAANLSRDWQAPASFLAEIAAFRETIAHLNQSLDLSQPIARLRQEASYLVEGWLSYRNGMEQALAGANQAALESERLALGAQELADSQWRLEENMFLAAAASGQLQRSLTEALDGLLRSEAILETAQHLAADYRSYMDNERNRESSVGFLLRTQAIARTLEDPSSGGDKESLTLWQRLLRFLGLR